MRDGMIKAQEFFDKYYAEPVNKLGDWAEAARRNYEYLARMAAVGVFMALWLYILELPLLLLLVMQLPRLRLRINWLFMERMK